MSVNIIVEARGNESTDRLVKRFLKTCKKQEIIKEYLSKTSYFKTNAEKAREKREKHRFASRKRNKKKS